MTTRADAEGTPDEIAALQAALIVERAARTQAEARATGAEAMVAHLKLTIAKLKHARFGRSAERSQQLLDQLELQLEELETGELWLTDVSRRLREAKDRALTALLEVAGDSQEAAERLQRPYHV